MTLPDRFYSRGCPGGAPTGVGGSSFNRTNVQIGDFVEVKGTGKLGRVQNVNQNAGRPNTFDVVYDDGETVLDVLPHLINWDPVKTSGQFGIQVSDNAKATQDPSSVDTFTAWQQDSARHAGGFEWRCDGNVAAPTLPKREIYDSTHTVRPPIHIIKPPESKRRVRFCQPPSAPTPIGINQSVTPPSRTGRSFTSYVPPDWLAQHSIRKKLERDISEKEQQKQALIDKLPEYIPGPSTPFPGKASSPWVAHRTRPTLDELRRHAPLHMGSEAGITRAMTATGRAIGRARATLGGQEAGAMGSRSDLRRLEDDMRKLQGRKRQVVQTRFGGTPISDGLSGYGGAGAGYTPGFDELDDW